MSTKSYPYNRTKIEQRNLVLWWKVLYFAVLDKSETDQHRFLPILRRLRWEIRQQLCPFHETKRKLQFLADSL